MDYTPTSVRRVLVAFAVTLFVALTPALFVILHSGAGGVRGGEHDGYRGVVLGAEVVTMLLVLLGLLAMAAMFGRRAARRPTRV